MADNKSGFKFYNVDTDRYQDMKIKRLKKKYSCNGIAVYDYILCEVYRVRGCFTEWDDNFLFDVADYFSIEEQLVTEIVNFCCNLGLFDKIVFAKLSIITSRTIQERFVDMSRRAKRTGVNIPEEIHIIREVLPKVREESGNTTEVSDRVEKSKEEEKKEEESRGNYSPKYFVEIDELEQFLKDDTEWCDIVCSQNGFSPDQINEFYGFIEKFVSNLRQKKVPGKSPKEAYDHFVNWFIKQLQNSKQNGTEQKRNSTSDRQSQLLAEVAEVIATN